MKSIREIIDEWIVFEEHKEMGFSSLIKALEERENDIKEELNKKLFGYADIKNTKLVIDEIFEGEKEE